MYLDACSRLCNRYSDSVSVFAGSAKASVLSASVIVSVGYRRHLVLVSDYFL